MAGGVARGVAAEGERQVLGVDAGPSEDAAFWTAFLRSLVKRGLRGVRLVISDAHEGLKKALATVLGGASWQRCRVHFMRNLLATVPPGAREPVAALVRTIFAQPDHRSAIAQLHKVADGLRPRFAQAAALLEGRAGWDRGAPGSGLRLGACRNAGHLAVAPGDGAAVRDRARAVEREIRSAVIQPCRTFHVPARPPQRVPVVERSHQEVVE